MPKERFFCIMEKILLIQTASIGDVILLTSLMEKLHDKFPNAAIDLVVKSPNEQLFANHPYVRDIWVWNKKNGKYRNLFQIICGIREQHYDVVLCVQRFFSAGLMCVLSGAKHRIGFDKNPLSFLFTEAKPHRIEKGVHEIDRNISLLSDIWCERVPKPRLYPSAKDFGKTAHLRTQAKEYYTLSPCSLWETKTMSKEKWVELLSFMAKHKAEAKVFLLGSRENATQCGDIIRLSGNKNAESLCGELSLLESAALMQGAKMNFVCDSAPLHLCSAVDAPVTAVFCSTTPDFGFGPLSSDSLVIEAEPRPACKPCGLHGAKKCKTGTFACCTGINMQQLFDRV